MKTRGTVYLVGAGPGDIGLVTLRAKELVERADVVVYDYLCNPAILRWCKLTAQKIYAGKSGSSHTLTQEEINSLIVRKAKSGAVVVRLKGGDPFVFGRGGEEAIELVQAGISFEVVPGVTSAVAAPAYAGIPVTHRECSSSLTLVTGHENPEKDSSSINWAALAKNPGTTVFLMGVERLDEITARLIKEGASPKTPAAVIRWGSTGRQRTITASLAAIAAKVRAVGLKAPAIFVLGEVVAFRQKLNWFETRPLFGLRVVVTRTREQSSVLAAKFRELGADVIEIPTIKLVPTKLSLKQSSSFKLFSAHYDWLVFTSPNAVDFFFREYFASNADIRSLASVKLAAVGPATAAKLRDLHLKVDKQPRTFTTRELAAAFSKKESFGKRFCLPRSNLANPELSKHLKSIGAKVDEWSIYNTLPETMDETGERARFMAEGADWITFASSSAVENWHSLALNPAAGVAQPKIASIGPVTSEALVKLGYKITLEASQSTISGIVESVLKYHQKNSHKTKTALR